MAQSLQLTSINDKFSEYSIVGYARLAIAVLGEHSQVPIGELLSNMDRDNNQKLSTKEIYDGSLSLFSDIIDYGYNKKHKSNENANKKTTAEKLNGLGLSEETIISKIEHFTKGEEIDLNNIEGFIGAVTCSDINEIKKVAKEFSINLDLNKLTLEDLFYYLELTKEFTGDENFVKAYNSFAFMSNSFKNHNYFEGIKSSKRAFSDVSKLYHSNPTAKNYLNNYIDNATQNNGNSVKNFLGNNCVGKSAAEVTKWATRGIYHGLLKVFK